MQSEIQDLINRSIKNGRVYYTDFSTMESYKNIKANIVISGGIEQAERQVLFALPDFLSADNFDVSEYIVALRVQPSDKGSYSHRDYLGSLMALQIERGKIGDIVATPTCGYVICARKVAEFLEMELKNIGKTSCTVGLVEFSAIPVPSSSGEIRTVSVSSMRLDAVLSAALRISRGEAQQLVEHKLVKVGGITIEKSEKQVAIGSVITARGYGRLIVRQEVGSSKKAKTRIEVEISK